MSDERRNRDLRYFLGIFTVFMVISFLYVFDVHGASELMVFLMMLAMLSLYGYRTSNRHNKWQLKVFVETVLTALFLYIILVLQPALNTLNWYVAIGLLTTLFLINAPQLKTFLRTATKNKET
ncbi:MULTISPECIES: hypothetical protein [Methanothermobacter]|jgi:ABC-type iron transport system FetAB permease component|uniref:Uncharacterized protein n=2 Tax=Methanothermobacter TaxID=145260 RepID=O26196_METTH|nr:MULTISPECIES: hypothetical protein [Methanothermobacter]MDN5373745.1 hypothetical protein [Methanothermobacter sp.]AAB84606.1 unknown [Methanothermobacter thermautotrophicus str. Delta H]UXH32217.1 hypothetical protein N5910_02710 [Methanothermobacter wolfeii]WBF06432.1 hypothetical protein ISG35_00385 [Methanothermobacter thermautotrophicus]WBF08227.1 hypothetical protein ISG36_00455 [Methanothermobacter thermautotrophicus]